MIDTRKTDKVWHECPSCGRYFKRDHDLARHTAMVHGRYVDSTEAARARERRQRQPVQLRRTLVLQCQCGCVVPVLATTVPGQAMYEHTTSEHQRRPHRDELTPLEVEQ